MASAMLVSRNETSNFLSPNHHHQPPSRPSTTTTTNNFMGKIPFLNPNPNPNPNSNFNNHNNNHNNFSRKQLNHQNHQNGVQFHGNHTPDDAASLIHHQNYHRKLSSNDVGGSGNGNNEVPLSHYVNYDISTLSKAEIRSLKTRLMSELDKVRSLSTRIESGDFRNGLPNNHIPKKRPLPFQPPSKEPKRGKNHNNQHQNQHHHQQQQQQSYVASAQVMKMCAQVLSKVMKQKAGYVFNEPVDVVGMGLHDYHQIIKRPMDLGTIKKNLGERVYSTPDEFAADVRLTFNNALMYNPKGHEVHTLAEKFLAKFEQYLRPVSQKFLLEKHQSSRQHQHQHHQQPHPIPPTPILPPPPQQKQHKLVDIRPKEDAVVVVDEVQGSSWSKNPSPEPPPPPPTKVVEVPPKKPEPRPEPRIERVDPPPPQRVERIEPRVEQTPQQPPPRPEPVAELVQTPVQEAVRSGTGRGSSGKLPKPKAKDPNKREMNMEEKHKLGAGLQSLPEEKMSQVIQIIRKRNGHLTQDGDEIELDIEAVDTETLWELDRFVTNYKKMVSKLRRQALMDMQNNNVGPNDDANQVGLSERMVETSKAAKRGGGGDVGEEDVDIGDEMPVHNFPPVEIDKDDDRHQAGGGVGNGGGGGGESSDSSSSSSSGSDSSSSSDSDSGSSSGSDSDVDDAQSRDNESKNVPR